MLLMVRASLADSATLTDESFDESNFGAMLFVSRMRFSRNLHAAILCDYTAKIAERLDLFIKSRSFNYHRNSHNFCFCSIDLHVIAIAYLY